MNKLIVSLIVFMMVAACGKSVEYGIQSAVRERLKDPESAKFAETLAYENFSCIRYNAKNGYGGYAGMSWALLKHSNGSWQVLEIDRESCYMHELKQLSHLDKEAVDAEAKKKAEDSAIAATVLRELKLRKLVALSVNKIDEIPSINCQYVAFDLLKLAREEASASDQVEKAERRKQYDSEVRKLDTKRC